jgi:prolipoprotein diacylglyceryltransferase
MDAVAPALLVAQAIGRMGNYFNQELFGRPASPPWGVQIAPQFRPGTPRTRRSSRPFLYELIFDLALAAMLVWLGRHRPIRPPGLFALYVAGYSAFRIFEESLRIDSSEHFLGLRLNFYIACGLMLFGFAWFARTQRTARRPAKGAALLAIGAILCAATAGCGHAAHPGQPAAMPPRASQAHLVAGRS